MIIYRSSSFNCLVKFSRSSRRHYRWPEDRSFMIGFRIIKTNI